MEYRKPIIAKQLFWMHARRWDIRNTADAKNNPRRRIYCTHLQASVRRGVGCCWRTGRWLLCDRFAVFSWWSWLVWRRWKFSGWEFWIGEGILVVVEIFKLTLLDAVEEDGNFVGVELTDVFGLLSEVALH